MKLLRKGNPKFGFGLFGICLAVFGLLTGTNWKSIFDAILHKFISLRPDSEIFDFWKTPPVKIELDFYFYNWTNSEDFFNHSTKPILKQLGPYRFIEKSDKFDIRWHPENSTVSYSKRSFYYFDPVGSRGKLSDKIVTLNLVALTAAKKVSTWEFFRRHMVTLALNMYDDTVVINTTVDELLFTGHKDILMKLGNGLPLLLNEIMPFDRFGYCYLRNGSADFWGKYNIYTGADDFAKIGQVHTWNYKQHSGVFDSYCGMVNGTPGEFQKPHLKVNSSVSYFISDFCRSIPLDYKEQVDYDGVKLFKYIGGARAVDNGTLYPENKCYCVDGKCTPSGVMNIAPCWFDAPLYISFPHFYNADPSYLNGVEGMHPNKEDHELYVLLEPTTGFAVEIAARLQLNVLVQPIASFRLFRNVPRVYFPILWVEEKVKMPPQYVSQLKLLPIILVGGKVLGAILTLVGLAMVICHLRARFRKTAHFVNFNSVRELQLCDEKQLNIKTLCDEGFPLLDLKIRVESTSVELLNGSSLSSSSTVASLNTEHISSLSLIEAEPE